MLPERYFDTIEALLARIRETQIDRIHEAGRMIADALLAEHMLHAFGAGHAGMLAQELCYRAGGLVPVNPIYAPGIMPWDFPLLRATMMEQQLEHYGAILVETAGIDHGDVLLLASPAGRIAVVVEAALAAKRHGATTVAITSLEFSRQVRSFHSSAKRLFEAVDLVIDDCTPFGDAGLRVEGVDTAFAPTSTVALAAITNGIVSAVVERYRARGETPPIVMSGNIDGATERNRGWFERFRGRLRYM